jgi:hypothetical protein
LKTPTKKEEVHVFGEHPEQLYPAASKIYPERSVIQFSDNPMPVRFANVDHILVAARER